MISDPLLSHKYKLLMENLYRLMQEIYVYECGIKETENDIEVFRAMLQANYQARDFLRNEAEVVAIGQLSNIIRDCYNIQDAIKRRYDSINTMKHEITKREKEANGIKVLTFRIKADMMRGKILEFKRDKK